LESGRRILGASRHVIGAGEQAHDVRLELKRAVGLSGYLADGIATPAFVAILGETPSLYRADEFDAGAGSSKFVI
jgi:hypothetical protein